MTEAPQRGDRSTEGSLVKGSKNGATGRGAP
jgi:hypothetical protein